MLYKENSHKIIIKKTKTNSSYKVYYFNCEVCNTEICAQVNQLKRHSGKCRSCSQHGKPYEFIYNELKNHRNKDVEFTLTLDEFLEIIKNNNCHYCDKELIYHEHSKNKGVINTRAHQLDRKNNLKGYTLENVVPCCWTCNRLKSDAFTYEEFLLLKPILTKIQKERKYNDGI